MAIPVSIFYSVPHQKDFDHYIRFCFVKVRVAWGGSTACILQAARGRKRKNQCVSMQDEATLQAMDKQLQKWKA